MVQLESTVHVCRLWLQLNSRSIPRYPIKFSAFLLNFDFVKAQPNASLLGKTIKKLANYKNIEKTFIINHKKATKVFHFNCKFQKSRSFFLNHLIGTFDAEKNVFGIIIDWNNYCWNNYNVKIRILGTELLLVEKVT